MTGYIAGAVALGIGAGSGLVFYLSGHYAELHAPKGLLAAGSVMILIVWTQYYLAADALNEVDCQLIAIALMAAVAFAVLLYHTEPTAALFLIPSLCLLILALWLKKHRDRSANDAQQIVAADI